MQIRAYSAGDDERVIALWNECLTEDPIDRKNFYQRIIYDVNFDPERFLLSWAGETLTGFIYVTARKVPDDIAGMQQGQGWIVAMAVAQEHRGHGVAKQLLAAGEEALKRDGVTAIAAGPYSTNYFFPGVDKRAYASGLAFLKANGYQETGESCSMDLSLRGYVTPQKYRAKKQKLEAQGYRFALYTPGDALPLFDFLKREFAWWLPDVRRTIAAGRAEETLILAHGPGGDVVGFVLRAMDGTSERFGPFGTKQDLQGTGLGTVLFHEMMENLVSARVFYTYFLWTGGRNLDIYGTWGMKVYRTYAMMSKTI